MSNPTGRTTALVALIVGPSTLIATNLAQLAIRPTGVNPTPADVAGQFPNAWLAIGLLAVFGPIIWLLGLPAVIDVTTARRGATIARLGSIITAVGLAAGLGHLASYFSIYNAIAATQTTTNAAAPMVRAANSEPLGNVVLIVFLVCYSIGPIVLTLGLRIARRVAMWVPIAVILTSGANLFGGPIAGIVQFVALAATWGAIAVAVRRFAVRQPHESAAGASVGC